MTGEVNRSSEVWQPISQVELKLIADLADGIFAAVNHPDILPQARQILERLSAELHDAYYYEAHPDAAAYFSLP